MTKTWWKISEVGEEPAQVITMPCLEPFYLEGQFCDYDGNPIPNQSFYIEKKYELDWWEEVFFEGIADEEGRWKFKVIEGGESIEAEKGTVTDIPRTISWKGHYYLYNKVGVPYPGNISLTWEGRECTFNFTSEPKQIDIRPGSTVTYSYLLKDDISGKLISEPYKVRRIYPDGRFDEEDKTGNTFSLYADEPYGRQKLKWIFEDNWHKFALLYWRGWGDFETERREELEIGIGTEVQLDIMEPREKKYSLNAVIGKFKKYQADAVIWGVS